MREAGRQSCLPGWAAVFVFAAQSDDPAKFPEACSSGKWAAVENVALARDEAPNLDSAGPHVLQRDRRPDRQRGLAKLVQGRS